MIALETDSLFEIRTIRSEDAEYRVIERSRQRVFNVIKSAPDEPLELVAKCPYSYNRETVRARAIRIAEFLRDEDG